MKVKTKIVMFLVLLGSLGAATSAHARSELGEVRADDFFFYCSKKLNSFTKHLYVVEIGKSFADGKRNAEIATIEGLRIGGTPLDFAKLQTSDELAFCSDRADSIVCKAGEKAEVVIPRNSIYEQENPGHHSRLRSNRALINGEVGFCAIYDRAVYENYVERREIERNTSYGE